MEWLVFINFSTCIPGRASERLSSSFRSNHKASCEHRCDVLRVMLLYVLAIQVTSIMYIAFIHSRKYLVMNTVVIVKWSTYVHCYKYCNTLLVIKQQVCSSTDCRSGSVQYMTSGEWQSITLTCVHQESKFIHPAYVRTEL